MVVGWKYMYVVDTAHLTFSSLSNINYQLNQAILVSIAHRASSVLLLSPVLPSMFET